MMKRFVVWSALVSITLALGGCPAASNTPTFDPNAARATATTANFSAGSYNGNGLCTATAQTTGAAPRQQTNPATLNAAIDAAGNITIADNPVTVGAKITSDENGVNAVQTITEITQTATGVIVKYTTHYSIFDSTTQQTTELDGGGQFKIGVIDANSILYIDDSSVSNVTEGSTFTSSLSCTAILRK